MYCFFFKQKTAYEMRISDWSSDVCSSDLYLGDPLNAIEEIGAAEFQAFRHVSDVPRQQSFSAEEVAALLKDRKSVVKGKSVSVRVDLGGLSIIKKKKTQHNIHLTTVTRNAKENSCVVKQKRPK